MSAPGLSAPLPGLLTCTRCALATTRHQVVAGDGDPGAPVVFLGEAPGAQEDLEGRPFIGRSGQLLRETWAAVSPLPAYILNTVRCRPPENRRPRPQELEACRPWLLADLARTQPRVVVALGRTAAASIVPATVGSPTWLGWHLMQLGAWHGPVAVLLHPAAVLRARTSRLAAWRAELAIVHRVAQGGTPPPLRVHPAAPPGRIPL